MSPDIGLEELRQARQLLRNHFAQTDPRLVRLFDEPFLNYELYDNFGRFLEFRTEVRGVIVDTREDMFDAFFHNVGTSDEVRLLTIATPVRVENYMARISAACLAWIFEGYSEQAVLNSLV